MRSILGVIARAVVLVILIIGVPVVLASVLPMAVYPYLGGVVGAIVALAMRYAARFADRAREMNDALNDIRHLLVQLLEETRKASFTATKGYPYPYLEITNTPNKKED